MVKVNAPALSLGASGKLGNALVFAQWKGRAYVRELVQPSNPKSAGQTGIRAAMTFLSQYWATLSTADQATWEDLADSTVISPFNAYCSYNLKRWRSFEAPSQQHPAAESDAVGTIANQAATGGIRQIDVEAQVTILNQNWAIAIFRSDTTAFSTAWNNCIAIIPAASAAVFHHIDTPLTPATYYYNFRPISIEGVLGAEVGEVNAAAT